MTYELSLSYAIKKSFDVTKNTIPPIFAFLTYSGLFYYKTTDYGLKGGLSDRDWNTYKNKTSIFLRVFVRVYVCEDNKAKCQQIFI